MAHKFSPDNMAFQLGTQTSFSPHKAEDDTPFCIAVLADFSARAPRGICETGPALASRGRLGVDIDNLEELPARLGPALDLPLGEGGDSAITIHFTSLRDFMPDQLFSRLELFQRLQDLRQRLQNPTTFSEAAAMVKTWGSKSVGGNTVSTSDQTVSPQGQGSKETDEQTLERLLGQDPAAPRPVRTVMDMDAMIAAMVKPYIVPAPDPRQADLVAQVEQAMQAQMATLLHRPDFQALEASWRMLEYLATHLETDEMLKIYAIDISKPELAADLSTGEPLSDTGLYRLIVEQRRTGGGGDPYTVLVGGYSFDQSVEDITLLQQIGRVAQTAGAPFLASADSHFAGCTSLAVTPDPSDWTWQPEAPAAKLWQQLRRAPESHYIGLILPRFLQRLPYGPQTDPIDSFDFTEYAPLAGYQQYLWGHPAVLCVTLLVEGFRENGWSLTNALGNSITGMPLFTYKVDGQGHVIGCSEALLSERAMQILIDKGLMPILSVKGQDTLYLPRFQSIAEPLAPLAGLWR